MADPQGQMIVHTRTAVGLMFIITITLYLMVYDAIDFLSKMIEKQFNFKKKVIMAKNELSSQSLHFLVSTIA